MSHDDICSADADVTELGDRLDDIETRLERIELLLAPTPEGVDA